MIDPIDIRTNIVLGYPTNKGNIYTREIYDSMLENTSFPVKIVFGSPITEDDDSANLVAVLEEDIKSKIWLSKLKLVNDEIVGEIISEDAEILKTLVNKQLVLLTASDKENITSSDLVTIFLGIITDFKL